MSDYISQIQKLQEQVDSSKLEQARLQERKKSLVEEKQKIVTELGVYEIKEENLNAEIEKLDKSIQEELKKCEDLIK